MPLFVIHLLMWPLVMLNKVCVVIKIKLLLRRGTNRYVSCKKDTEMLC